MILIGYLYIGLYRGCVPLTRELDRNQCRKQRAGFLPVITEAHGLQSDVEGFSWLLETAAAAAAAVDTH
jgi:hypothetical protein